MLFCGACFVSLLVVPCPLTLPVALWPCALRCCVLRCSLALCALCCVCFVVACWCVLLLAAVLCALCVPVCRAVRSLSSSLCAVLWSVLLVRLRRAVHVVRAVTGAWCCGALLCVVLLPLAFCGAVLGLAARGCLLVVCFGVGVPVTLRRLLPCGWRGSLCCPASLCFVLWCCAVAWCCAVVCACFALLCPVMLCCAVLLVRCAVFCPVVASACCGARSLPAGTHKKRKTLFIALCYPAPVSVSVVDMVDAKVKTDDRRLAGPRYLRDQQLTTRQAQFADSRHIMSHMQKGTTQGRSLRYK